MTDKERVMISYSNRIAQYEVDLIGINEDVKKCIDLLKVDGKNTKKKALEILEELKERYLKDYE